MAHCCFMQGCELEVQYVCQCMPSVTYFCEFHLQTHLKLPNRAHLINSILTEPSEFTKDIALKLLSNEKAKTEKLKKIAQTTYNKNQKNAKKNIKSRLSDLNSDLKEINRLIEEISQVEEKDPVKSLTSEYDADKNEAIQSNDSEKYDEVRIFCELNHMRNKKAEILDKSNNNPETEQDFRRTCSLYQNHSFSSLISQAYKEYTDEYQQITSTFLWDKNCYLYSYITEIEWETFFYIPGVLNYHKTIAKLPNGELFIIGCKKSSQIVFILDKNHQIRNLPLGAPVECFNAIYFNRSVYCFGKISKRWNSRKFDFDKNRWIELASFRKATYHYYNSVVFNRNIFISLNPKNRILLYSIDIDSFSEIPYRFAGTQKTLISTEERLYLIENNGWIYESEDEYNWNRIAKSIIKGNPKQVHCAYNKGGIYISFLNDDKWRNHYKFDLNKKTVIDVASYRKKLSLQRSVKKFEKIDLHDSKFKPGIIAAYIDNRSALYSISKKLKDLNKKIKYARNLPDAVDTWTIKGNTLCDLGIYREGIECYNKAIEINPNYAEAYNNKGLAFQMLGKHIEAIECFNKTIEIDPNNALAYSNKANSLCKFERNFEAIECLNKAIKLEIGESTFYRSRGNIFWKLGREEEAFMDFFKADELRKTSK